MSFDSLLIDRATIHERTAESDVWTQVGRQPVRIRMAQTSPSGARAESPLLETGATHRARCRVDERVIAGRRLKRIGDGAEFLVLTVRLHPRPVPGQMVINLAEVEGAV